MAFLRLEGVAKAVGHRGLNGARGDTRPRRVFTAELQRLLAELQSGGRVLPDTCKLAEPIVLKVNSLLNGDFSTP